MKTLKQFILFYFICALIGFFAAYTYDKSSIGTKIGYYIATGKWVEIKKGKYYIIFDNKFKYGYKIIVK